MWQSIVTFLSFYLYTMFCRTNVFRKKIATQFLPPWQILSNKRLSDKSRDTIIHKSQLLSTKCLSNKSVDKIFSFKDAEIIVIMLRWQLQTDFKRRMNILNEKNWLSFLFRWTKWGFIYLHCYEPTTSCFIKFDVK